jgi:hypothetical protein
MEETFPTTCSLCKIVPPWPLYNPWKFVKLLSHTLYMCVQTTPRMHVLSPTFFLPRFHGNTIFTTRKPWLSSFTDGTCSHVHIFTCSHVHMFTRLTSRPTDCHFKAGHLHYRRHIKHAAVGWRHVLIRRQCRGINLSDQYRLLLAVGLLVI